VDLEFVKRVFDLVGEHACRKTGDDFLGFGFVGYVENVIVNQDVVPEEGQLSMVQVQSIDIFKQRDEGCVPCISCF